MMEPVNEFVIIKPLENEEKTQGGIIVKVDKKKEEVWRGEVVAVEDNEDLQVKAGDTVLYDRYEAKDAEIEGQKLQIVAYDRILAILAKKGE